MNFTSASDSLSNIAVACVEKVREETQVRTSSLTDLEVRQS